MLPIIKALAGWKGRRYVQERFASLGFRIHEFVQQDIFDECGADERDNIQKYWDEMAKERVCSVGKALSSIRDFRGLETYRSSYLDLLASTFDYQAALPIKRPELHPCLFHRQKKQRTTPVSAEYKSKMERRVREEALRLGITDVDMAP